MNDRFYYRTASYTSAKPERIKVRSVVFLLFILYLFASIIVIPLVVRSSSMSPSIEAGHRLIFTRLINRSFPGMQIRRGDVVVVRPPYLAKPTTARLAAVHIVRFLTLNTVDLNSKGTPETINPYMVRRVIGLPGDRIKANDFIAFVKPQGEEYYISEFELMNSSYKVEFSKETQSWSDNFPGVGEMKEILLGEGEYFVLGDNREIANDSRTWGSLPRGNIRGKALFLYRPIRRIDTH